MTLLGKKEFEYTLLHKGDAVDGAAVNTCSRIRIEVRHV